MMAEWSKAPSVEPLVVTGSDPALANDYLFSVYSSLYDHSGIFYFVCIYVSQSRASLIKVTSLNEADMVCWKNNLYGKTLARQKNTNELIFAKPSAIRHFKK